MTSTEHFYMEPIVGEILGNDVVFLLTPTSTINIISLNILYDNIVISTQEYDLIPDKCNRIVVSVPEQENILPGVSEVIKRYYTFQWVVGNNIVSSHRLCLNDINKIIFVSCDLPEGDTRHSLWNVVGDESPDICCHIGDNIYGDDVYHSKDHNYEYAYRKTWSRWTALLHNTSHIMIADDHDITDGYDCNDYDKFDKNIVEEGMKMFKIYQEGLLNTVQQQGFVIKHLREDTTLIMVSRTFLDKDITETLKSAQDIFRKDVIIAISSAPIPMPHNIAGSIYETVFGRTGWDDDKLKDLYDFCFSLIEKDNTRKVILIGGDIHIGVYGQIIKNNLNIPVYIASPITNHPSIIEYIYAKALTADHTLFDYNIKLRAKAKRNYLKIMLPLKDKDPGEIIWSNERHPKSLYKFYSQLLQML